MNYRILTLVFIASVLISSIFLVYAAVLYFDTSSLTRGVRVSIQTGSVEQSNSSIVLKNVILIENPSPLSFTVTYVQERVYDDPNFANELGQSFIARFSGDYITLVTKLSNSTINFSVSLTKAPSTNNVFVIVSMRFADIPILESYYLTRYFSVPLNASSGGGIR